MRVGCGSATIGMFAKQWFGKVDEVVVVDDHITGVLSEHQAGKLLGVPETGIKMKGRRSTPGRYFRVAEPGTAWGGTNIEDPLSILQRLQSEDCLAETPLADGEHHRRALCIFRTRRSICSPVEKELPAELSESSRGSRRIASRRCGLCFSWAEPEVRCGRASPRTLCGSHIRCATH